MRLNKGQIDKIAKKISEELLCACGLKDGKKVAMQIKRNLLAEEKRRKAEK